MQRFSAALALLLLSAQAHATLAVLIPTRDGFVVAADSRLTYMGAHCDGASKILIPALPSRTVAVVTGDSVFVAPPPTAKTNPCEWLASSPRLLDINSVVTSFLKASGSDLAQISTADLAAVCVHDTEAFQQNYPAALRAYRGKELFSVLVASYDPGTATTTLRSFVVRMNALAEESGETHGHLEVTRLTETKVVPNSPSGVWIYGEANWFNRVVYQGSGRRLLTAATLDFLSAHPLQSTVTLGTAETIAANLMQSAARAAQLNPPASGIGGEIRMMGVGSNPLPQQLPSPPSF